jgi:eukaryotic-like serine/threonine-protein kinase
MKRCPECGREYDLSMSFCLDDGAELLYGPASMEESATIDLPNSDEVRTAILSGQSLPSANVQTKSPWWPMAVGLVLLAVGGIGFALYKYQSPEEKPAQAIKIERLTTNGKSVTAAISPDGKFYVYTLDEGGKQSLWVRQLAASKDVPIIPAEEDVYYWGLSFTPDGNYINFVKVQFEKNTDWPLYQMPVFGGTQKKLIDDADGGISYSPDAKQFAFVRDGHPTPDESSLMIANADGSGERILSSRKKPEAFNSRESRQAWSPDGKTIACMIRDEGVLLGGYSVVEINVDDGTTKPIATQEWNFITAIAWLPNKSGLLVMGSERSTKAFNNQLWHFSYPDGKRQRVTTDLSEYSSIDLAADARSIVTVQSNTVTNIWVGPSGDASRAVQVKSGGSNREGMNGLAWTPDGRIVYNSVASGIEDIWIMNADGSGAKQLTADSGLHNPTAVTPDGRYLVFFALRDEKLNLWRMDLDGGNQKQLTIDGTNDYHASISPDSRWVVYSAESGGKQYLWKVSIDGGEAVQITNTFTNEPKISPDGKWILCSYRKDENSTWRYAIIPFEGGEPTKVFDLIGKNGTFRWSPDSRSLYYPRDTHGRISNIWRFPLDGEEPKQLTDFKTEWIYNFALSTDGKQMAYTRGTTTSDVVLISGFK